MLTSCLAAVGVVVAGVGASAPPAGAATRTVRCSDLETDAAGTAVWQRIDADLLVDSGTCSLRSVGVHGDVTVAAGSELQMTRTSIHGDLRSSGETWVSVSTVDGDLLLGSSASASGGLSHSTVKGSASGFADGFVFRSSTIVGGADLTAGVITLWHSTVGGRATLRPAQYLTIDRSTVSGDLTVDGTATGWSLFCSSTVGGDLDLSGTSGSIALGVDWDGGSCRSTVDGSVRLIDNTGNVALQRLLVTHDLVCTGNTRGVVISPGASIRGTRSGQCA